MGNAGTQLDALIGPWIEHAGNDHFRISPLLQNAGYETLSLSLRRKVHFTATETIVDAGPIDVAKADGALLPAMLGDATGTLARMSYAIMQADWKQRKQLSEWMPSLRSQPMDRPIYAGDLRLALLLRCAQLVLIVSTGDAELINECWASAQASVSAETDAEVRDHF